MENMRCPHRPCVPSASSSPTNFLLLSKAKIDSICKLIRLTRDPLNPRQCLSVSSKLKVTLQNIESLASLSEVVNPFYGCVALDNFCRVSEKAKKLVENCCSEDWCRASVFQIQNEEAFREILVETSLSYSTIYELLKDISKGNSHLDLRSSSTFDPPSPEEVFEDRVALRGRLEGLVNAANISSSDRRSLQLGKYLLGRVNHALKQSTDEKFDVRSYNLSLDGEDLDGVWSEKIVNLGDNVTKTAWFDVPCAKKEFQDRSWEEDCLEANILASLNHPNIVKFLCWDKYENDHSRGQFIAMELLETNLTSFIRRRKESGGKLSFILALDVMLQIGYGMCYLHDHGIAHRDLKARNVVCRSTERFLEVKVVDFGLSKIKLNEDESITISNPGRTGTTTHMAPEAYWNGKANWFKADVYSFSVMCSEILSGEEPFQGMKYIRAAVLSGQRPNLPYDTPKELALLIKEGWDENGDLRPTFLEICARLEKLRHRLLRNQSLPSLGLGLEVEDRYSEEYPGDSYIEETMKNRSERRHSKEGIDGDEVEEQQQSVQTQQQGLRGSAPQKEIALGMGAAEDGRSCIHGSSSCGGLQVSRWGSSSGFGVGGVNCPQTAGIAVDLSSSSFSWSSPTDGGTVDWLCVSSPLSVEAMLAEVQGLTIPQQLSADVPFHSAIPKIAATSWQAKGKHPLRHCPLHVAPSRGYFESNPAATPSFSGANQGCPRPMPVSRKKMAINYLDVDYGREASSSIKLVEDLLSQSLVQLHLRQCQYFSTKLTDTRKFLKAKSESLVGITSADDIRWKALRQLHFTVKCAEKLVRGCCCEVGLPWLESAVTLTQIKEDIVHILLDLRWWTSMVDIAIVSVTPMSFGEELEQVFLEGAEKNFQKLLHELQSPDSELYEAFVEDKQELLRRVREVLILYSDRPRDPHYLLATHVQTRLEKADLVQSMTNVDLNAHEIASFIGKGSFGAVMNVQWLGRNCALKVLECKCLKEATSLSSFQHPHIVQFFRYWEAPASFKSGKSTPYRWSQAVCFMNSMSPRDDLDAPPEPSVTANQSQSNILMELLPTDLAKHMRTSPTNAMPQDVAIDVMLQVTKAMWHLNKYNVAHRDLKPSNVLVQSVSSEEVPELAACGYLRVKLGDFGLVSTRAMSIASSMLSGNVGTKIYGAPEVFVKDSPFPKESRKFPRLVDVWSFGIMFSEVLTGKPPFLKEQTHDEGDLHILIQKGARPELPANCPDYLKFCITNCLQLRPQDRPNFTDLWKLLRFAQARSLGIIREDHDLFTFTTREGVVKSLRLLPVLGEDPTPSTLGSLFRRITSLSTRRSRSASSVDAGALTRMFRQRGGAHGFQSQ